MKKSSFNKKVLSWALYDFANSAFTTLVVTFIYGTYFTQAIAINEIQGTQYWSWAISISAVLVAFFSPFLGALADQKSYRKKIMFWSTLICIVSTTMLFFPIQGQVFFALVVFVIANIAFEFGTVFCNSYLKDLVPENKVGKTSGLAWGLGYFGGLISLVLALVFLVQTSEPIFNINIEDGQNIRATNLLVAFWFLIFSVPFFLFVKDPINDKKIEKSLFLDSFWQLKITYQNIKEYKNTFRFLIARLLYNDGLITIFAFGGIYAADSVGFGFEEIILLGIVLNLMAGLGAILFAFFEDKIGSKKVIKVSILFLMLATFIAFIAPELRGILQLILGGEAVSDWLTATNIFWIAAILLGLFSGPNQSASRALMAKITPNERKNEFFGFYAFSGKSTSFLGPLLFGFLTSYYGTQQAGLIVIFVFFLLGLILLKPINE